MPHTALDLCSAALVKLGARPLAGFDEGSAEAAIAGRLYPVACDALLGAHPWGFSLAQAELTPAPEQPAADFAASFLLPADMLRAISAGDGGRGHGLAYRILGDRLHASAGRVLLTYQRRAPEELYPAHFVAALVARLAAEFCLPVTESASRTQVLAKLAEAEMQLARLVDSQQATPPRIDDAGLLGARLA
ncbi:hypothetical protein SH611_03095 [Geminicoccaceae bacterium 1502E]|nr:hypothetical protein [Geminicoccaceae bacterium 1502E]